jgi:hypothetical protein
VTENKDFPWTHDQFQRYAVLKEFLDVFHAGEEICVLDVGGVSFDRVGKRQWLPIKQIQAMSSYAVDKIFCSEKDFIQAEGTRLPFRSESFDVVSAMDVLEHIPPPSRADFLKELCRVSRDKIVVSFPYHDKNIQNTESVLFDQIRTLYNIEHLQLKEHKAYGLPAEEAAARELRSEARSVAGFKYGSLKTWILLQSLKNCFMFKEQTCGIHSILDRCLLTLSLKQESQAPLARQFWFCSMRQDQAALDKNVKLLQRKLKSIKVPAFSMEELVELNHMLTRLFFPEAVSAVIVSSGDVKCLEENLRRVMTQRVQFDLEIAVWDLSCNQKVNDKLKADYPGVRYISASSRDTLKDMILKIALLLKGQYFLFVWEEIDLPPMTVQTFYDRLHNARDCSLLTPEVASPEEKTQDGTGEGQRACSEVLFMRRGVLAERDWQDPALSKENIFCWENRHNKPQVLHLDDFVVNRIP